MMKGDENLRIIPIMFKRTYFAYKVTTSWLLLAIMSNVALGGMGRGAKYTAEYVSKRREVTIYVPCKKIHINPKTTVVSPIQYSLGYLKVTRRDHLISILTIIVIICLHILSKRYNLLVQ
jgi:hypothetical protein